MGDRSGWIFYISRQTGDLSIRDVPSLRAYLKKRWGQAPLNCGSLAALEAIAARLGVEGAKDGDLKFPSKRKDPESHPQIKRKISREEILRLKREGKENQEIAAIAGVSREWIRQIWRDEQKAKRD
jgi:DNA-binding NarL/FixJ family response regulator